MSAPARDGASFMPSPTKATRPSTPFNSWICSSFSAGIRPLNTSSSPSLSPTSLPAEEESPVSMTSLFTHKSLNSLTARATPGFTWSDMRRRPSSTPSRAT